MTAASSFAPSSQRSSGRVVTDADSSPEKVVGLEERRSKRSAVVRLASAPLLDVADEPLSPRCFPHLIRSLPVRYKTLFFVIPALCARSIPSSTNATGT